MREKRCVTTDLRHLTVQSVKSVGQIATQRLAIIEITHPAPLTAIPPPFPARRFTRTRGAATMALLQRESSMMWKRVLGLGMAISLGLGLSLGAERVNAEPRPVQWPAAEYQSSVPSFQSVLGYAPGEVISSHQQMSQYFQALQAARPEMVKLVPYAKSWEGRELFYAIIAKPEYIEHLSRIEQGMQALAQPDSISAGQADLLIESLPSSAWLSYAVHGNEISSTDAAMMTAYHLLAAGDDPVVQQILENTLVFLDPLQNPDGRDRFVNAFRQASGLSPDVDRYTADHDEPWPGGRTNHYHFDLNRDWLALTQPEISGQVEALLRWHPLVFVDAHEMGSDSTYYFAPEAVPFNPHIASAQRDKLQWFGQNNARWFDQFGIDYFTREVFDAFYPGYGASWPLYYGAIAMTYEQASVRGLAIRRADGEELAYAESVRNHFLTSISTLETAAKRRTALLRDFYNYRVEAAAAGAKGPYREYVLNAQPDPSAADKLAGLLVRQGIAVRRATADFKACGKNFGAGSYAISLAQPSHRLIRTLLDPEVNIDAEFLKEQERRRERDLPDEIYDVTAWSLPLMFNVPMERCKESVSGSFAAAGSELVRPGQFTALDNAVAYLAPWGTQASARLLSASLRQGLLVKSNDKSFRKDGRDFPSGTLIFTRAGNPDDLAHRLQELSRDSGAEVLAVADSWVESGPNFGSENVSIIHPPRIALLWDAPTAAPGQTRFVLERQYGYPVSALRVDNLSRANLDHYQVLIIPESFSGYDSALSAAQSKITDWVKQGGTLITLGSASRYLSNGERGLSALRLEQAWVDEETQKHLDAIKAAQEKDANRFKGSRLDNAAALRQHIVPLEEGPDSVAGVLLKAKVDQDHWLSAGLPEYLNVLYRGSDIYAPLRLDQGRNLATYLGADELLASGQLWEENRQQLAFKPFFTVEPQQRGFVIAFTADPNYRAYMDGLNLAFINAVFRAPAHAGVVR